MSAGPDSERVIDALVEDLEPVRPIPALRHVALAVISVWLVVGAVSLALLGISADGVGSLLAARAATAIHFGLGVAGAAGVLAALALGVPGREWLARVASGVGLLGLSVAGGLGSVMVVDHAAARALTFLPGDLKCLAMACVVGLLPALVVIVFLGRAAPFRPLAAVLGAAAGAATLGSVSAQLSCPHGEPQHLMLGHVIAPVAGVLLLTLPLLLVLRRLGRRPRSR